MFESTHLVGFGSAGAVDTEYKCGAANFNGTSSKIQDFGNLGASNDSASTVSFWFKLAGGDGDEMYFIHSDAGGGNGFRVFRNTSNKIKFEICDGFGGVVRGATSDTTYTVSSPGGWNHVVFSHHYHPAYAAPSPDVLFYINGADDELSGSQVLVDGGCDFSGTDWSIGASLDDDKFFDGDLAEIYMFFQDSSAWIDLRSSTIRERFRFEDTGKPQDITTLLLGMHPYSGGEPRAHMVLHLDEGEAIGGFDDNDQGLGNAGTSSNVTLASTSPTD